MPDTKQQRSAQPLNAKTPANGPGHDPLDGAAQESPTFAENAALTIKLLIGAGIVLGLLWLLSRGA